MGRINFATVPRLLICPSLPCRAGKTEKGLDSLSPLKKAPVEPEQEKIISCYEAVKLRSSQISKEERNLIDYAGMLHVFLWPQVKMMIFDPRAVVMSSPPQLFSKSILYACPYSSSSERKRW